MSTPADPSADATVPQGADLAFAGLARLSELLRAGEVTPRALVELYLERIERLNPTLNAFVGGADRCPRAGRVAVPARSASSARPPMNQGGGFASLAIGSRWGSITVPPERPCRLPGRSARSRSRSTGRARGRRRTRPA